MARWARNHHKALHRKGARAVLPASSQCIVCTSGRWYTACLTCAFVVEQNPSGRCRHAVDVQATTKAVVQGLKQFFMAEGHEGQLVAAGGASVSGDGDANKRRKVLVGD